MIETITEKEIVPVLAAQDTGIAQVIIGNNAYKHVASNKVVTQSSDSQNENVVESNTNSEEVNTDITLSIPHYGSFKVTPDVKIHFPEVEEEVKDIVRDEIASFKGKTYVYKNLNFTLHVTEKIRRANREILKEFAFELFGYEINPPIINAATYTTVGETYIPFKEFSIESAIENIITEKHHIFLDAMKYLGLQVCAYLPQAEVDKSKIISPVQEEGESDEDFEKKLMDEQKAINELYEEARKSHLEKSLRALFTLVEKFTIEYQSPENKVNVDAYDAKYNDILQKMNIFNSFEGVPLPPSYISNGRDLTFVKTTEDKNGLSHISYEVIGTLCTITEISHTDDGKPCYVVAYVDNGKVKKFVATQRQLFTSKGLESVVDDILIMGNHFSDYIKFFKELLSEEEKRVANGIAPTIKQGYVTSICGWKGEDFVIGDTTIGRSGKHYMFADKKAARSMKPTGSLRGWATGFNYIGNQPVVQYKNTVGLSVPLLRITNLPSSVCNHTGDSTLGKTTSMKGTMGMYANSIITDPDTVIINANAGTAALEPILQTYTDLPTSTDENCLAEDGKDGKKKGNFQKDIAYTIPQGQGKPRSNGGKFNLPIYHWRTKMFTTGEHLTFDENANKGQAARVTEFNIQMPSIPYEVDQYEKIVEKERNFAWFMPYYIKIVICYGDDNINELYERVFVEFDSEDRILRRKGKTYALEAVAGLLFNATCDYIEKTQGIYIERIPDPIALVKKFAGNSNENVVAVSEEERAMRAIFDDILINSDGYNGKGFKGHRGYYKDGEKEILIIPSIFEEIIRDANLTPLDIKRKFKDMTLTSCEGERNDNKRTRYFVNEETKQLEKITERFICIDYKKADELVNGVMSPEELEESKQRYLDKNRSVIFPESCITENTPESLIDEAYRTEALRYWNEKHPDKQEAKYKHPAMCIFYKIKDKPTT